MANNELIALYRKFLANQHTPAELDRLLAHFEQADGPAELRTVIQQELKQAEFSDEENKRIDTVTHRVYGRMFVKKTNRSLTRWLSTAAALLVVGAGLAYWWYGQQAATVTYTATAGSLEVTLPDGSTVWLNDGATISYIDTFKGNKRTVDLTDGQAYFEITPNPSKPFTVHAPDISVEVLGTAFEITSFASTPVSTVSVTQGNVKVHARSTEPLAKSPTLSRGHRAAINRASGEVDITEIDPDDIAGWKDNRLVFALDDFAQVIEALQRHYRVTINVEKQRLYQEKITLRLEDEPLDTALSVLSITNGFTYEFVNDSTVVIR